MKIIIIIFGALAVTFIVVAVSVPKILRPVKQFFKYVALICFCILAVFAYYLVLLLVHFIEAVAVVKWKSIHILTELVSINRLEKKAEKRLIKFRKAPSFYGQRNLEYLENLCLLLKQRYHFTPERKMLPYRQMDDYHFLIAKKKIEEKHHFWSKALDDVRRQMNLKREIHHLCWSELIQTYNV